MGDKYYFWPRISTRNGTFHLWKVELSQFMWVTKEDKTTGHTHNANDSVDGLDVCPSKRHPR